MALALLPWTLIESEYARLKNKLSPNVKRKFNKYCTKYFEDYWLKIVKPYGFSIFGLERRTNNVLESFNMTLQRYLGISPPIWDFTGKEIYMSNLLTLKAQKFQTLDN